MALDTSNSEPQTIGNYDLLVKLAEGGMGTVYKGRNRETGQIVAIKIVPPNMTRNVVLLKRFEQEFKAASKLDHPNIVRALDYCGTGSTPFLVMEFVEGESLGQKLDRDGRLPEDEAIRLIVQVCQGLHRAHKQGLIHRDVKPDNIMVTADGQVKLTDLGLVKEMEAELNLTRTGRGLGTPHFMAPEQFRNAKNADVRCDIYSLGATLYMMVTGDMPFESTGPLDAWMKKLNNEFKPPRQLVPTLSERMDWAIRRAMSADPECRPATCREFVEDLTGQSSQKTPDESGEISDLWYFEYHDKDGVRQTVKGNTESIRLQLKEGLLGVTHTVRASRTKTGSYELLRSYPEFRDLVVAPGSLTPTHVGKAQTSTPTPVPTTSSDSWGKMPKTLSRSSSPSTPPPSSSQSGGIPHIQLETSANQTLEWLQWLLLIVLAGATAIVATHMFFPR